MVAVNGEKGVHLLALYTQYLFIYYLINHLINGLINIYWVLTEITIWNGR